MCTDRFVLVQQRMIFAPFLFVVVFRRFILQMYQILFQIWKRHPISTYVQTLDSLKFLFQIESKCFQWIETPPTTHRNQTIHDLGSISFGKSARVMAWAHSVCRLKILSKGHTVHSFTERLQLASNSKAYLCCLMMLSIHTVCAIRRHQWDACNYQTKMVEKLKINCQYLFRRIFPSTFIASVWCWSAAAKPLDPHIHYSNETKIHFEFANNAKERTKFHWQATRTQKRIKSNSRNVFLMLWFYRFLFSFSLCLGFILAVRKEKEADRCA